MKAPKSLIPLALFVLAFAGSLFLLRRPESPGAVALMPSAQSQGGLRSLAGADDGARPLGVAAGIRDTRTDTKRGTSDRAKAERTSARPRFAPSSTPVAVDDARPGELASSIASPDSRAWPESPAARDARSSSADVAQSLDALSFGPPDDRVRAIQSLAATEPDAPELARVRSSLRLAAADEDPDIAARAQEAYDSLMTREDP